MRTAIATVLLWAAAVQAQPASPCGQALEGDVSRTGCTCRHRPASLLSDQPAGWRWVCDLLRQGAAPTASADLAGPSRDLPTGFVYAPQGQAQASQLSRMRYPGY